MFGSPLIFETDPSRPHLPDGSPPDPGLWLCTGTGFGFGLSPPPQTSPPHLPSQKKKKKKEQEGARRHARASKTNAHSPSALLRLRLTGLIAHSTRLLEARSPPSHARLREALLWTLAPVPVSLSPLACFQPNLSLFSPTGARALLAAGLLLVRSGTVGQTSHRGAAARMLPDFSSTIFIFF